MNRQKIRGFLGQQKKKKKPGTIRMDTWHYIFAQTHRMYSTKREPHCELWASDNYDPSA